MRLVRKLSLAAITPLLALGLAAMLDPVAPGGDGAPVVWIESVVARAAALFA